MPNFQLNRSETKLLSDQLLTNLNITGRILEKNCAMEDNHAICIVVISNNTSKEQIYPVMVKSVDDGDTLKIDTNILGMYHKVSDRSLVVCDSTPERCVK